MRNLSRTIVFKKATLINKEIIMLFSNIFNRKKTTTIKLDTNVSLTLVPAAGGGVHATLSEMGEYFSRQEKAYFASLEELTKSLKLTDGKIIRKLSKAF